MAGGEMSSWWNVKLVKWPIDETARLQHGKFRKLGDDAKTSWWKWQVDEMASWWNGKLMKW